MAALGLVTHTEAAVPLPTPDGPSVVAGTHSCPEEQSLCEAHWRAHRLLTQTFPGFWHFCGAQSPSQVCVPFTIRVNPPSQNLWPQPAPETDIAVATPRSPITAKPWIVRRLTIRATRRAEEREKKKCIMCPS
jgi:hypothetical protein